MPKNHVSYDFEHNRHHHLAQRSNLPIYKSQIESEHDSGFFGSPTHGAAFQRPGYQEPLRQIEAPYGGYG